MNDKRIEYIDTLRVFACFLVMLTHSVMQNIPANGTWLSAMSLIASPSSELFLALSGAVLLPVHVSMREFYKRRFMRLLPPMLIWSLLGIVIGMLLGRLSIETAFSTFILLPIKPVNSIYWFLYVMIGLYLLAPYVSYWLRESTQKQLLFFLGVWGVTMLLPWLNLIKPGLYNVDGSYYFVLCYFGGFLGYWILGYYLRRFPIELCSVQVFTILFLTIFYMLVIVFLKVLNVENITQYYDNLQLGSALCVTSLFMFAQCLSKSRVWQNRLNRSMACLANYSFGMYLIHPYLIRDGVWKIFESHRLYNHPVGETLLIVFVSIVLGVSLMKFVSLINPKLAEYVFGMRVQKKS